ncbi:hypothetical protein FKP32DRAFT_1562339 [Trametes sanguinea]|nr:hypothetical protein FKP32DRAFT_1562339 [Trametes sanguinea]
MCVTSPNQAFIPEYPVERRIVKTYSDGRWGVREYSRWPQLLCEGMWHLSCIPRATSQLLPWTRDVLWHNFQRKDWHEDKTAAIENIGLIDKSISKRLEVVAELAITTFEAIGGVPDRRKRYGYELIVVLRQCIDRMKLLPAPYAVAVAVAAHVQRICLELAGLCVYLTVVLPRIESDADCAASVLDVVGTFVKNGNAGITFVKAGVPVFFVQPLSRRVKVWKVVSVTRADSDMAADESVVPIWHRPSERAGIVNLAGFWTPRMMVAISRDICASLLAVLPARAQEDPPTPIAKRSRVDGDLVSKELAIPVRPRPEGPLRAIGTRKGPQIGTSTPSGEHHPAREHLPSPLYAYPSAWAEALSSVGILRQPPAAVLYLYPPPFLLDTFSIPRYLHNLVRIRQFCRLRLFDPTVDGKPLSIAEWRAALFGNYEVRPAKGTEAVTSTQKQGIRRREERNAVSRLFGNIAEMRSYDEGERPTLLDVPISKELAAWGRAVRMHLVWEAHEINFRGDLMALDRVLVPRDDWPIMLRWQREAEISEVWGQRSGIVSILPTIPADFEKFFWREPTDPRWRECLPSLRRFIRVMKHWPDFPTSLRDLPKETELWDVRHYQRAQQDALLYYTRMFVDRFDRLPIPPIMYPCDDASLRL